MNELISVIVPIYNAEKYLHKCLRSIQEQSYRNIEVILVDDGSTDQSADICINFCETDHRFIYFKKKNGGDSSARNLGLKYVNGQFFGFCDSDDWLSPTYLQDLYAGISGNDDVAMVIAGMEITDGEKVLERFAPPQAETLTVKAIAEHFWDAKYYPLWTSQCNKLYRTCEITSEFDAGMTCGMDMRFNMLNMSRMKQVAFVPSSGYHYLKLPTQKNKYPRNSAAQCLKYSDSVRLFLEASTDSENFYPRYEQFLCDNMCRDAYTLSLANPFWEAKRLICEFYRYPEFRTALQNKAFRHSEIKYRIIASLLKLRCVSLLIIGSKIEKKLCGHLIANDSNCA